MMLKSPRDSVPVPVKTVLLAAWEILKPKSRLVLSG